MTDITDLITRLEGATEGSHDLDWTIAEALGWTKYWSSQTIYLPPGVVEDIQVEHPEGATVNLPKFSRSVDAALTLIPPDVWLNMGHRFNDQMARDRKVCFAGFETAEAPYYFGSHAETFPIAICLASLKARSRQSSIE
jgi:hypothetical protein